MDPAFEGAGEEPGLSIWRIEDFKVVPYPKEKFGQFHQGDSYIVLYTEELKDGRKKWDLHFWLGSQTSQDEAGTAAIKAVELDDQLGGVPVQHREVEAHESTLFTSRFKKGVFYLKGGVASGFRHVDPDEPYPARLFHVKGRKNVRVSEVDVGVASMNKGDCFILDAGKEVYVYMGALSKRIERLKAIVAANGIRDDDHAGGAKVVIIDETAATDEVEAFFEALGGASPDDVPESDALDDAEHERSAQNEVTLLKVREGEDGSVESELISGRPLLEEMLSSENGGQDCFLLDTGGSGIFVWIGSESSSKEKIAAMDLGTKYLDSKGYPKWTKVERVVQKAEPTIFKQYFKTWKEPEDKVGLGRLYSPSEIAKSFPESDFDVRTLHSEKRKLLRKNSGPAYGFVPDDGSGKVEVFRVEDFDLAPCDEATYGFFFGGDSYVLKYTYEVDGAEKYIVYFWQGSGSSQDERASSAMHAVRLDNELSGKAVQVRVVQGHEPQHFLRIFKGRMVIFMGGRASGFKNIHDHDTYDADGTRLFQVRGTCDVDVRAIQRPEEAAFLNSDDVFILETPEKAFIWLGKNASEEEKRMAGNIIHLVTSDREVETVAEGDEDDAFWSALGGRGEYQQSTHLDKPLLAPRLFYCSISPAGCLRVREIPGFDQEDLSEDDVMLLDSGDEVYVWVGQGASEDEKDKGLSIAKDYIKTDPSERTIENTVIIRVKQGEEPPSFSAIFPAWNPDMWQEIPSYDDIKARIAEENASL